MKKWNVLSDMDEVRANRENCLALLDMVDEEFRYAFHSLQKFEDEYTAYWGGEAADAMCQKVTELQEEIRPLREEVADLKIRIEERGREILFSW